MSAVRPAQVTLDDDDVDDLLKGLGLLSERASSEGHENAITDLADRIRLLIGDARASDPPGCYILAVRDEEST